MDCLFCKIISGKIPSHKIYEDDHALAILDINPVNPGHTLIIPKEHSTDMREASDETIAQIALATKKVAQAIIDAQGNPAYNIEVNTGEVAGQVIPHTHWHIVPRTEDDGLKHWPGKQLSEEAMGAIADNIRSKLS